MNTERKQKEKSLVEDWADKQPKLHEHSRKPVYKSTIFPYEYLQPLELIKLSLRNTWQHGDGFCLSRSNLPRLLLGTEQT